MNYFKVLSRYSFGVKMIDYLILRLFNDII